MEDARMSMPAIRPGAFRAIMESASEALYCSHQAHIAMDKAMFSLERSAINKDNPYRNRTLYSMEISKRKFMDMAASPSQTIVIFSANIAKFTVLAYSLSSLYQMLDDQYVAVPQPILTVLQGIGLFNDIVSGGEESARWMDIPDALDSISISSISGTFMTWDWIGSIGIAG
jgi:hypothetical protein